MAVCSAISVGFPSANYVVELGQRESALPGEYIVEGGQAIVTVVSGSIDDLTLAATGVVIAVAQASPTIGNLTLSAVGNLAATAPLTKTIDPITLAATGEVIVSAAVDATIDPITAAATAHVASTGDVAVPWWWAQVYVARHQAEPEARCEALAVTGDGAATIPLFVGQGLLEHATPAGENVSPARRFIAAAAGEVPGFLGAGELEQVQDGDIDEVMAAVRLLLGTPETVNLRTITHILEGPGADDDDEVLEIVEALIQAA